MVQHLAAVTVIVPDYGQAIDFYVHRLGFRLVEDTTLSSSKRWVLVSPPGEGQTHLLLAKAATDEQAEAIGHQAGGRVFLFLATDDFDRDHAAYQKAGATFLEQPRVEPYGKVAVFRDPFGNKWDLIQPASLRGT